jgi:hypothetical protein
MNRGKTISLSSLTLSHRDEIDMMLAAICGTADSPLWTAKMRAATRGGKPCTLRVDAESLEEGTD